MHAHYSQIITSANMLDSILRLDELSASLSPYENAIVAVADTKLYGLLQFYRKMKDAAIQPVLGLTVRVSFQEGEQLPVILYAENQKGYNHLLKISSAMSVREEEDLPMKWLQGYSEGLIVMLPVVEEKWTLQDESKAKELHTIFEKRCYIGIERLSNRLMDDEASWVEFAENEQIPIVSTQKVTYLHHEDAVAYEAALAIQQGVRIEDRHQFTTRQSHQYLPLPKEMKDRFEDRPEWLQNERDMLKRCHVDISFTEQYMPIFKGEHTCSSAELLTKNCLEGLEWRGYKGIKEYENRLHYELQVITKMGYEDYFLIVADYIAFARSQNILTGPGRGSSTGSLVAYCLEITAVDPIQHGLLFERFLNPERISLPDIDVDFVDARRQEVIEYVAERYGKQYVAQIITFGTLSVKAVARDVARVMGFSMEEMSQLSSLLQARTTTKLQDAMPQLLMWVGENEARRKWLHIAQRLEGLNRNASTHAAGVILSPIPLPEIAPIELGSDNLYMTQWPMKEAESIGLLKMDFLGLRNLSILDHIRNLIQYNENRIIDFNQIPLSDEATYRLLQNGDTIGVFQLESKGMREALAEIKPTQFNDIVAVNALYRPGPLDFIPVYARRKHGQERVIVPHDALLPILNETFGVIVYQGVKRSEVKSFSTNELHSSFLGELT